MSKSTQLIFLNGSQYARFAVDTGAQLSTLATWDGFFEMAGAYRQWSQGKPFCALDYPLRLVELNALEQGSGELYKGSWYDLTNETFRASWMEFARALVQGDILISDLYSNTQVMTGETLAGLGSSAAILYYNDFVTYPDNTSEPVEIISLPCPTFAGGEKLVMQRGAGICTVRSTPERERACMTFLKWLTAPKRNVDFVTRLGYMPVTQTAFANELPSAVRTLDDPMYVSLYQAFLDTQSSYTFYTPPQRRDYLELETRFEEQVRLQLTAGRVLCEQQGDGAREGLIWSTLDQFEKTYVR